MAFKIFIPLTIAFSLYIACVSSQSTSSSSVKDSGEDLLRCSELTDLTQLTLCLSKTVSRGGANKKSSSAPTAYGYPHRIAPTLPPFLIGSSEISTNDVQAKRRIDSSVANLVKRIQIYAEPGYRNLLDLDATLSQRVLEYRPIYGEFPVPMLIHPVHHHQPLAANAYTGESQGYYGNNNKPVKHRGAPKKAYGGYYKNGYPTVEYNTVVPQKNRQKSDYGHRKYGEEYERQHHKSTGYDPEYFVPANSPITGDIRRSLLDYSGARDLMIDEGDYLGGSDPDHQFRNTASHYYPFRRSDVLVESYKDLEADESNKSAPKES